jgi:hypothetical protein
LTLLSLPFLCTQAQKGFFGKTNTAGTTEFTFEIVRRDNHKLLAEIQITPGQEIEYAYIHSSDGTPVEQSFILDEDGLLQLMEERYAWYGAGLEFGSGYEFDFSEDMVKVSGYDRSFAELPLRVARTVPQEFTINGQTILLSDLAPGGTSLLVRVTQNETP